MGELLYTYEDPTPENHLEQITKILSNDGVICFDSGANWSLACDYSSKKAIERIKALKPTHKKEQPFSLMCNGLTMAAEIATIDTFCYRILKKTLPGDYTYLLPRNRTLPKQIKDKRPIVGIQIPSSSLATEIISRFGNPLATSTVPAPPPQKGELSQELPKFGYEIEDIFGHALDLIIDTGKESVGGVTTIIDLTRDDPEIVREGLGSIDIL